MPAFCPHVFRSWRRAPCTSTLRSYRIERTPFFWVMLSCFLWSSSAIAYPSADSWESVNTLGMQAYQQGRYTDAKQWFLQALAELDPTQDPSPRRAMTLNNLAAVNEALGEYEKAELHYQQSLAIIEAIQGPMHPDLISGLNNLASLYQRQGRNERAEPLWRRSLTILERILGPDHPHVIPILRILAEGYRDQHRLADAEAFYTRALRIAETHLTPNHRQLATILLEYADFLRETNREDEALLLEKRARAMQAPATSPEP
ncbi:MAG: tetratricopeptide repeat protein [Nitrospirae bacterium]|nr:MAG: tetratricopeptide repeat protein [Nitrospirota bacterium]